MIKSQKGNFFVTNRSITHKKCLYFRNDNCVMKKIFLFVCCILWLSLLHAQNPVKWSFEAKKTGDKVYELRLTAAVNDPWHIYSQFTPDGGPQPTKISFNKNPL